VHLDTKSIKELLSRHSLSQNQLARDMGIARGTLSNALSGRRGAGRKVLAGLLRTFPEERLENFIERE